MRIKLRPAQSGMQAWKGEHAWGPREGLLDKVMFELTCVNRHSAPRWRGGRRQGMPTAGMAYANMEARAHSVQGRTNGVLDMKCGKDMPEKKREKELATM